MDKKSVRKRIRAFFKIGKSPEKTIKSESKLSKIQKQFLKNSPQYQTAILNEPVRIFHHLFSLISLGIDP